MARIAGINIPPHKHTEIGLTSIYGVGRTTAQKICTSCGIPFDKKVKDLTDSDLEKIREEVGRMTIEGDLRREMSINIKRLMDLGCYRGVRHRRGIDRGRHQYKIPYINSDIEVNARIIGHARKNLDFRLPDQPDTTQHMREVAYSLRRAPMNTAGTKSAILDVRKKSYESFKLSELERSDVGYPVSVQSLKKGMRQYTRLIQHHESELPSDIDTPEGRQAFIRAHGS